MNKIFLLLLAVVVFSAVAAGPVSGAPMESWEIQFYDTWELWDLDISAWDPYVLKLYEDMKAQHTQNATATATPAVTATTAPTPAATTVVPTTAIPTTAVPTTVPPTTATSAPTATANVSASPAPSIPVIPIIIGIAVILLVGIAVIAVLRRRSASSKKDTYVPAESVYDYPTVEEKTPAPVPEEEPEPEEKEEIAVPEPEIIEPMEEPVKIVPKTVLPPEESYAKVADCIAQKYSVRRAETLTPRQLIAAAEPSRELSEFVSLYERIKYSPATSVRDISRLSELADIITEQYS
ncbi:MAG: hypothetical protein Q4Q04_06695 [Methanocorpusculum sp.]|nr:hypothetical protein [Methanocorpusculum sp.]